MSKAKIFPAIGVFLLVFASVAIADYNDYDINLKDLKLIKSNVCQGEDIRASVDVSIECPGREATLYWYVDGNLVSTQDVEFRIYEKKTVTYDINTDNLFPGEHRVEVVSRTACFNRESLSANFDIKRPAKLYDIDIARPELELSKVTKGCCGDDLKVETRISAEDYDSIEPVGVKLTLYVYDNAERSDNYIYKESKATSVGSGSERTVDFWFNPSYLSGGKYYFFVQATEKEGVCSNSLSEWSKSSTLEVSCDDCGKATYTDSRPSSSTSEDEQGAKLITGRTVLPDLAKLFVYILVAAILIVIVLIIVRLLQGSATGSKRPM